MAFRANEEYFCVSILERYEPDTLRETLIAETATRKHLEEYVYSKNRTGKVLLFGNEGCGKTTIVKNICNERLGASSSFVFVERGKWRSGMLDEIVKVYHWAASTGETPVVIIEAVEHLKEEQEALSEFINAYKDNMLFLLTANHLSYVSNSIISYSDMVYIGGFTVDRAVIISSHYLRRDGVFVNKQQLSRLFTECLPVGEKVLTMRQIGMVVDELIRQSVNTESKRYTPLS